MHICGQKLISLGVEIFFFIGTHFEEQDELLIVPTKIISLSELLALVRGYCFLFFKTCKASVIKCKPIKLNLSRTPHLILHL